MDTRLSRKILLAAVVMACTVGVPRMIRAQRTGYPDEEFVRRRQALAARLQEGMLVLFGVDLPTPGAHTRQDNDFYYLTGVEDLGAVLTMNAKSGEANLFLPRMTAREEMMSGPNLLKDDSAKARLGFANIYDVTYFDEFIARNTRAFAVTWVRLQPGDTIDNARSEVLIFEGRKNRLHYNDQVSRDIHRLQKLQERFAGFGWKDVTPHLDALRMIKTGAEIDVLRRNG